MKKYNTKETHTLELEVAKKHHVDIKNVKYFKGHDGMQGINADIYHKGIKFATAYDDARGGGMDIRPLDYTTENLSIFKKVEDLLRAEPEYLHIYDAKPGVKPREYKSAHNLENLVDALALQKEQEKEYKKGIIFQDKHVERIVSWKSQPLPKMAKTPRGLDVIQKKYDQLKEDYVILNTDFLSSIGIRI